MLAELKNRRRRRINEKRRVDTGGGSCTGSYLQASSSSGRTQRRHSDAGTRPRTIGKCIGRSLLVADSVVELIPHQKRENTGEEGGCPPCRPQAVGGARLMCRYCMPTVIRHMTYSRQAR